VTSPATACLLAALAVWRVTHLLQVEDGPWDLLARARRRIEQAGSGALARMLACFYCLSLWVALPVAAGLATGWAEFGLLWAGLSGAAILLERLGAAADRHGQPAPPAIPAMPAMPDMPAVAYWEEGEEAAPGTGSGAAAPMATSPASPPPSPPPSRSPAPAP
jgi:hypothetical protein